MSRRVVHITVRPEVEVVLEEEDRSWGAYVPGMPGVVSLGDTREEIEHRIVQAIESALESVAEVEGPAIEAAIAEDLRARAQ